MTRRRPPESATSRVSRLLTMVPWLVSRQGVRVAEAAEALGVTEEQLRDDLELLWLCGYGTMPDELIDVSYEQDRVFVTNADTISAPLRLTVAEATTLVVGLRALQGADVAPSDAVERALAKIEAAAAMVQGLDAVTVAPEDEAGRDVRETATRALHDHRRLRIAYLVPSRDERTERDVDPMRVTSQDGHWYLEGWCHRAQATRLFRMDRIDAIEVLDVDGTPPPDAQARDLSRGTYQGADDDLVATVRLTPRARWVAEYYPVLAAEEDGTDLVVTLTARDQAWLTRLVLSCGGGAVVEGPPEAVEAVMAAAQEALGADPA